jgi:RNA polymerase sigma-70 factor (ECF subfamily)
MNSEQDEFRQLVESYQQKVFRLVASLLGPYRDADAEDIAQEVFLEAWRGWSRWRGEASRSTWLYAIARHKALDCRKRARFRLPHLDAKVLDLSTAPYQDPTRRLETARAVEKLPETYRTLLYLFYWQGASIEEIAEITSMPAGTVKSYLARARNLAGKDLSQ